MKNYSEIEKYYKEIIDLNESILKAQIEINAVAEMTLKLKKQSDSALKDFNYFMERLRNALDSWKESIKKFTQGKPDEEELQMVMAMLNKVEASAGFFIKESSTKH